MVPGARDLRLSGASQMAPTSQSVGRERACIRQPGRKAGMSFLTSKTGADYILSRMFRPLAKCDFATTMGMCTGIR
jgi:hypothetical protein